jgi:hypothetical protein
MLNMKFGEAETVLQDDKTASRLSCQRSRHRNESKPLAEMVYGLVVMQSAMVLCCAGNSLTSHQPWLPLAVSFRIDHHSWWRIRTGAGIGLFGTNLARISWKPGSKKEKFDGDEKTGGSL